MLIKDIIYDAAKMLDLELAAAEDGEEKLMKEDEERLLAAVGFVIDEAAAEYFPLVREDKLEAKNYKLAYSDFPREPTSILSMKKDGKTVRFDRLCDGIKTSKDGAIEVKYAYRPLKAALDGKTEWGDSAISRRVLAYGTAAEYCIMRGLDSDAELWDKRYRDALERAVLNKSSGKAVRGRRWI